MLKMLLPENAPTVECNCGGVDDDHAADCKAKQKRYM